MDMLSYIREIKINLRDVYGFKPNRTVGNGEPCFDSIPPGYYPMVIEGKKDWVEITSDGKINCCNFRKPKS